jgi:hypothetical protein
METITEQEERAMEKEKLTEAEALSDDALDAVSGGFSGKHHGPILMSGVPEQAAEGQPATTNAPCGFGLISRDH